jgi:phytoene dehydrogenase-like protein
VLVIGAGMAGLACAVKLHEAGVPVRIFEASDGVGGRVRTDIVDGYLLDRGFQVYLDAYPETGKLLDLESLDLRTFEPGAMIFNGKRLYRLMDVFRRPGSLFAGALAPIGSLFDKLRVARLRYKILKRSDHDIWQSKAMTTEAYLKNEGFSAKMIDRFFRSFYGGIFLERELQTTSRMFEFTFKLFSKGSATLPAKGMGEIPKQLAARLPAGSVSLNTSVVKAHAKSVELADGTRIDGSATVVATELGQAAKLGADFKPANSKWRSVSNVYFAAEDSPLNEAIIALNGSGEGLVNNVCVLSDASSAYAPEGKSLVSVSVLGLNNSPDLDSKIKKELRAWFGAQVDNWKHLRTDRIRHALPEHPASSERSPLEDSIHRKGIWICGDHSASASIEGAVISGQKVAQKILEAHA